jgi:hypothetical protein
MVTVKNERGWLVGVDEKVDEKVYHGERLATQRLRVGISSRTTLAFYRIIYLTFQILATFKLFCNYLA